MKEPRIIAWWSAGVTSAIACKLAINEFGPRVLPIYFQIDSAHPDNARFKAECEQWYGMEIEVRRSPKYIDHFDVIRKTRYVNGPAGARCTLELKKKVRWAVEKEFDYDNQVFGFEFSPREVNRALRFSEQYPGAKPLYPLIEHKMNKPECLDYLRRAGIEAPLMYKLGYNNNNCIGCVKGGGGYWNKIRRDFPDYFDKMAELERYIGNSCLRKKGKGLFLDELDPSFGRRVKPVMPDCGNFCEIEFSDIIHPQRDAVLQNPKLLRKEVTVFEGCFPDWGTPPVALASLDADWFDRLAKQEATAPQRAFTYPDDPCKFETYSRLRSAGINIKVIRGTL